jgi:uncharacterized coiled-coil DUF342 family protein
MQDISKIVDTLEVKIKKLLEKYDFLGVENDFLRSQILQLQSELNEKNQQIKDNITQIQTLRVAKTIQGSDDYSKETTQKINTLVKEIDWCINQLSE